MHRVGQWDRMAGRQKCKRSGAKDDHCIVHRLAKQQTGAVMRHRVLPQGNGKQTPCSRKAASYRAGVSLLGVRAAVLER